MCLDTSILVISNMGRRENCLQMPMGCCDTFCCVVFVGSVVIFFNSYLSNATNC
jgi:hypothetical protein